MKNLTSSEWPPRGSARLSLAKGERPRILLELGGESQKLRKLLQRLGKRPQWEITAFLPDLVKLEDLSLLDLREWTGVQLAPPGEALGPLMRRHHVVVGRASLSTVQQAVKTGCPMIAWPVPAPRQTRHFSSLLSVNAGAVARKPREVVGWLDRAFQDEGRLVSLWKVNLGERASGQVRRARCATFRASRTAGLADSCPV